MSILSQPVETQIGRLLSVVYLGIQYWLNIL